MTDAAVVVPNDPTRVLGMPTSARSIRSPFEDVARAPVGVVSGSSRTPLHRLAGTIIPADLQFERHHGGAALVDPSRYRLLVHGFVQQPMIFTLDDLKSLPSVTRVHFLECSGNGSGGYTTAKPDMTPQQIDGLLGNAEWTGVPVKTVLAEAGGATDGATWALAEGGDAALLSRSIPVEKLLDDALFVYAQNGEALRPSGGYPVRLFLPGWEGNTHIKWLRRLELIREPNMSKDETSKYTDPLPNGTARQFSFVIDAKSTLTSPTYPERLRKRGWVQLSGLAWSGRGKITAVDVSTDGGANWVAAALQNSPQPKAAVRFVSSWEWDGRPAVLMSRAHDETGYVQPTFATFRDTRGPSTSYHFDHIRAWNVAADGQVTYGVPS
jgi:sulfane dehydrogenase subunit SoxC